jgi:RNA recognition motif-containing protein
MTTPPTSSEPDSNIISNVSERLRFFFSDANLRVDKFLRNEIFNSTLSDGYVPITTLLRFNTLKKYTTDPSIVAHAVKNDDLCKDRFMLNEDETAMRRIEPFTEEMMNDNVQKTLRVSDIPTIKDDKGNLEYSVARQDVEQLFTDYGPIAMVRLLYYHKKGASKNATGRAFVEFETKDGMDKAVEELCVTNISDETLKPQKTLQIGGVDVRIKTMQQWLDKKEQQQKGGNRGKDKQGGNRGADATSTAQDPPSVQFEPFTLDWKPKCVIFIKGVPEDCDRESILSVVTEFIGEDMSSKVRADYSRGLPDAKIRFDEPNDKIEELTSKLNEGEITLNGVKVESASILEGEEEKDYYDKFIDFQNKKRRLNAEEKAARKSGRGNKRFRR